MPEKNPLVALVVGHSKGKPGAVSLDGMSEYEFHSELVPKVSEALDKMGIRSKVYYRTDGSYHTVLRELVGRINADKCALCIAFHFNAMPDTRTEDEETGEIIIDRSTKKSGTSGMYWPGSKFGKITADILTKAVAGSIGIPDRKPKAQARSWQPSKQLENGTWVPNGPIFRILAHTAMPAVILETHFGDNKKDHKKAVEAREGNLAKDVANAIADALTAIGAK